MVEDTAAAQFNDEDAALLRHAKFGKLPARLRPDDWVEESDTSSPAHELQQSLAVVQHPGRTYET